MGLPGAAASPAPRLCLHASALRYRDAVAALPWPWDLRWAQRELRPMDPMAQAALKTLGAVEKRVTHRGGNSILCCFPGCNP